MTATENPFSDTISTLNDLEPYPQPPAVQSADEWMLATKKWRKRLKDIEITSSDDLINCLRRVNTAVGFYAAALKDGRRGIDAYCRGEPEPNPRFAHPTKVPTRTELMQERHETVHNCNRQLCESLNDLSSACERLRARKVKKPTVLRDLEEEITSAQVALEADRKIIDRIGLGIDTADKLARTGNELLPVYESSVDERPNSPSRGQEERTRTAQQRPRADGDPPRNKTSWLKRFTTRGREL